MIQSRNKEGDVYIVGVLMNHYGYQLTWMVYGTLVLFYVPIFFLGFCRQPKDIDLKEIN